MEETPIQMTFGQIIARRLKELGMTKSELARQLGVTPSRIRALLKQKNMSEQVVRRCAAAAHLQILFSVIPICARHKQ